jgi:hypothetical protein
MRDLGLPLQGWLFFLMWFDRNALAAGETGGQTNHRRGGAPGAAWRWTRRDARRGRNAAKTNGTTTTAMPKQRGNALRRTAAHGCLRRAVKRARQLQRKQQGTTSRRAQPRTNTVTLPSGHPPRSRHEIGRNGKWAPARSADARRWHGGRICATTTRKNQRTEKYRGGKQKRAKQNALLQCREKRRQRGPLQNPRCWSPYIGRGL